MEEKSYKTPKRPMPPIIDLTKCQHNVIKKRITKSLYKEIHGREVFVGKHTRQQCAACGCWFRLVVENK
jgi:hypothetical protein